jgi:hypothetical protein
MSPTSINISRHRMHRKKKRDTCPVLATPAVPPEVFKGLEFSLLIMRWIETAYGSS